ncbi:hypothetical protein T484DRAFT_1747600 [Baffinella frigidus]|nr:hypothetical protein T484DRAFT_1747600 [Cryptophyta sp. CCMP2293]
MEASKASKSRKPAIPRVATDGVKKKRKATPKPPKPPRNPFNRSETGKLKLKCLQFRKRIETLTPRAESLRERLNTTDARLTFLTGKVKLIDEELASRDTTADSDAESEIETEMEPVNVEPANVEPEKTEIVESETSDEDSSDEEIELDDEIEDSTGEVPV